MQALSLKLDESILSETERIVKRRKISHNAYINEAVKMYNALERRRELRQKLAVESEMVAADSLAMLRELEALSDLYEN